MGVGKADFVSREASLNTDVGVGKADFVSREASLNTDVGFDFDE